MAYWFPSDDRLPEPVYRQIVAAHLFPDEVEVLTAFRRVVLVSDFLDVFGPPDGARIESGHVLQLSKRYFLLTPTVGRPIVVGLGSGRVPDVRSVELANHLSSHLPVSSPWVEFALRVTLPRAKQDEIIGDLLEEYQEDIIPKYGRWAARAWLLRHALSDVSAAFHLRWWGLLAWAIETFRRHVN
jgi:hypothetical protein